MLIGHLAMLFYEVVSQVFLFLNWIVSLTNFEDFLTYSVYKSSVISTAYLCISMCMHCKYLPSSEAWLFTLF